MKESGSARCPGPLHDEALADVGRYARRLGHATPNEAPPETGRGGASAGVRQRRSTSAGIGPPSMKKRELAEDREYGFDDRSSRRVPEAQGRLLDSYVYLQRSRSPIMMLHRRRCATPLLWQRVIRSHPSVASVTELYESLSDWTSEILAQAFHESQYIHYRFIQTIAPTLKTRCRIGRGND